MVVRFEHIWIGIPLLLIPIGFTLFMMILIRIWMFGAPKRERKIPNYSMHVMQEETPSPKASKKTQFPLGFRPVYAARPEKFKADPAPYPAEPPTFSAPEHAFQKKPQQGYRQTGQVYQQASHKSTDHGTDHGTQPVQYGQSQLI